MFANKYITFSIIVKYTVNIDFLMQFYQINANYFSINYLISLK